MKSVWTIVKKEFSRFFKDKRMIITILLPGVLIFVLYSIMGTVMEGITSVDDEYKPTVYAVNMPASLQAAFGTVFELTLDDGTGDVEAAKQEVKDEKRDAVIIFPDNFSDVLLGNRVENSEIRIFYNSANSTSTAAYSILGAVMEEFKKPLFEINSSADEKFDLASEKDIAVQIFSMVVPMLMFSLLASACVAVAPEAIAGEKERGTMATMLITPIKRWQLALGKILSLSVFALLSGLSSFIGVILSLPKLMAGVSVAVPYGVGDYFMIFGLIISIVLVIIAAFSVLSCLAKSVKEAGSYISPLMIVIILLGVVSMFFTTTTPPVGLFAIPLLGSALAISGIMAMSVTPLAIVLSIISNFVCAVALIVLLAFMFKSERIMFNK